jgi:AcrR family transcriptional regulator
VKTTGASRRQVHKPAATRRQELVDAAVRVIRRKGLLETTTRDVAAEAGTSTGLVSHYFDSQDDLLVAAFEQVATEDLARVRRALSASPDAVGRLRVLLDQFAPAARSWQYRMWIDVWAASAHHAVLRKSSRTLNQEWLAIVTELMDRGVEEGAFTCAEPAASAWRLLALLDGMSVQLVAGQGRTARPDLLAWVREAAAVEVGVPVAQLDSSVAR